MSIFPIRQNSCVVGQQRHVSTHAFSSHRICLQKGIECTETVSSVYLSAASCLCLWHRFPELPYGEFCSILVCTVPYSLAVYLIGESAPWKFYLMGTMWTVWLNFSWFLKCRVLPHGKKPLVKQAQPTQPLDSLFTLAHTSRSKPPHSLFPGIIPWILPCLIPFQVCFIKHLNVT